MTHDDRASKPVAGLWMVYMCHLGFSLTRGEVLQEGLMIDMEKANLFSQNLNMFSFGSCSLEHF